MGSNRRSIGLEGLPYAGKTTLSNKLVKNYKVSVIPEHTIGDNSLKELANKRWPNTKDLILKRQQLFLNHEMVRKTHSLLFNNIIIYDRTIISLIAYLHIRTFKLVDGDTIIDSFINECKNALNDGAISIPEFFVFLPATPEIVIQRAKIEKTKTFNRNTESFMLKKDVLIELYNLHSQLEIRLGNRVKTIQEMYNYLIYQNGNTKNNRISDNNCM